MLSNVVRAHEREGESILQVLGDIGGLMEFLLAVFLFILSPIAEFDFYIKAMKILYLARANTCNMFKKKTNCEQQKQLNNDLKIAKQELREDRKLQN